MLSNSTINGLRKDLYNVKNDNKQLTNDMLLMRIDVVSRLGEIYKNLAKAGKNKELTSRKRSFMQIFCNNWLGIS